MKSLPYPPGPSEAWLSGLEVAVIKINDIYSTAIAYLDLESYDTYCLGFYMDRVAREAYLLLLTIEEAIPSHKAELLEWLATVSKMTAELLNMLGEANEEGSDNEPASSWIPSLVTEQRTGCPGQPKKMVDVDVMWEALQRRIPIKTLAATLGIDQKTLKKRMKEQGLEQQDYSTISDNDLDIIIKDFLVNHPQAGRRKQQTAVKSHVQYQVKRPHAMWHIDSHHKLIMWGIVIHGMVDGYSRRVTGLRASTNNSSKTVLLVFLDAIKENSVPSKVRGDCRGENCDVSILMILLCGPGHSSFMWGKSTYNTRIERMWGNLGAFFVCDWRAFFIRLEHHHLLDCHNRTHLWLLHFLFLDEINDDCHEFKETWNNHPLSGKGHNKTPNNIEYQGMLTHGIYHDVDNQPEFNIDELYTYYDQVLDNNSDSSDSSNSEHEDSESKEENKDSESKEEHEDSESKEEHEDSESKEEHEEEDGKEDQNAEINSDMEVDSEGNHDSNYLSESDLDHEGVMDVDESNDEDRVGKRASLNLDHGLRDEARIATDSNISNKAVHTPKSQCPFNKRELEQFKSKLDNWNAQGKLPQGYGIRSSELGPTGYDPFETILLGHRGKTVTLELMNEKWQPRAEQWCQALYVLNHVFHVGSTSAR